jgi:NAD(P)-dependent dehydrogenase (short-subunit alcohol dehydrogenase family)
MDRLAGKTAVITGIGPGIGSAIARTFAREGADLILAGFANPAFEETAADLKTSGRLLAALNGDVGRRTVWDGSPPNAKDTPRIVTSVKLAAMIRDRGGRTSSGPAAKRAANRPDILPQPTKPFASSRKPWPTGVVHI